MRLTFLHRILFLVFCAPAFAYADTPETIIEAEPEVNVIGESYPEYNGVVVRKIAIEGLRRSREKTVRWLLGAREGQAFEARSWQIGIEHLYKTEALYDIHSRLTRNPDGTMDIVVTLEDKWTLFPYFDFQGGGGSVSFSTGIFDTNLLGTFTNAYLGAGYLDKEFSYEVGISQRWFLETSYSAGLQASKQVVPVSFQNSEGAHLSTFTWTRTLQNLVLGRQHSDKFYWELRAAAFRDSMREPSPRTSAFVFSGMGQYHLAPNFKFWKVTHSDYLEQGKELRVEVIETNPTQATHDIHSLELSWKQVFFLPETKNLAYYLNAGHMTAAPLANQFRLGGFESVRGFSMNRIFGLDFARANLEFRSTLLTHNIGILDVGKVVFQGCAFTDAGAMWNGAGIHRITGENGQRETRVLYSAGLGLRTIFLHFSNATVRLDVAKAIYPQEGFNVAFGVGQFF